MTTWHRVLLHWPVAMETILPSRHFRRGWKILSSARLFTYFIMLSTWWKNEYMLSFVQCCCGNKWYLVTLTIYCAFQQHASSVQVHGYYEVCFLQLSIIIVVTANEPNKNESKSSNKCDLLTQIKQTALSWQVHIGEWEQWKNGFCSNRWLEER